MELDEYLTSNISFAICCIMILAVIWMCSFLYRKLKGKHLDMFVDEHANSNNWGEP